MAVTYAQIDIGNFLYNLQKVKELTGRKICIAAKADCYGHGAELLVKAGIDAGLLYAAGLADISEAVGLRRAGIDIPLLMFRESLKEDIPSLIDFDISPFVSDMDHIKEIEQEASVKNKKCRVHLKIDTGMNRAGCRPEESLGLARYIESSRCLILDGVCTHFAVSESLLPGDIAATKEQIRIFKNCVGALRSEGIEINNVHCASSGAVLLYPETYFDMVRPGILLYGYSPSRELAGKITLKPVMDFVSHVILVKKVKKGERISYGFIWKAEKDTSIAVIGAGYADGYNRLLSNCGKICIDDFCYPVAGRVCMDQFMVDLGDNVRNVKRGDRALLFGGGGKAQDAFDAADICGTISYELLCNINKRVKRIYING